MVNLLELDVALKIYMFDDELAEALAVVSSTNVFLMAVCLDSISMAFGN